jgi:AraC family transcriptional regulator of adaptative response/methylated-DNA-[protein]-cysteine methyltransferase
MQAATLPPLDEMWRAFAGRDSSYDGIFLAAVRTTGIFCRPGCPARTPRREHVEFFAHARDALFTGYRPCLRCRPLEAAGAPPADIGALLQHVEADPGRRWRASDLRDLGLHSDRVRRWFQQHHGMSFHAYARARRLGGALAAIREGGTVTRSAFDAGYESLSGFSEALRKVAGTGPTAAAGRRIIHLRRLDSPLGPLLAGAVDEGLCLLEFAGRRMLEGQLATLARHLQAIFLPGPHPLLDQVEGELAAYFAGGGAGFATPLLLPGTAFQRLVWDKLRRIEPGTTISYGELAARIGRPSASRAVARANGDNRVAILVPCHRVIGADGRLTGYGGGLWRKQRLLELEGPGAGLSAPAGQPAGRDERASQRRTV